MFFTILIKTIYSIKLKKIKNDNICLLSELNDYELLILNKTEANPTNQFVLYELFKLYNRKIIDINGEKLVKVNRYNCTDNKIQEYLCQYALEGKSLTDLYSDKAINKLAESFIKDIDSNLYKKGFTNNKDKLLLKILNIIKIFLIVTPGILKLLLGLFNGKPVIYLIFELFATIIVLLIYNIDNILRHSYYCDFILEEYSKYYKKVGYTYISSQLITSENELLTYFSLFGISKLRLFNEYRIFSNAINSSYKPPI